jgi:hypothetical protein
MSEPGVSRRDASAAPCLGAQPDDMRPDLVDLAGAVVYLTSDASSYVSGTFTA